MVSHVTNQAAAGAKALMVSPGFRRDRHRSSVLTVPWWKFGATVRRLGVDVIHVHGLFVALHCALLSGCPMVWLPKFADAEVLAGLGRATVMMGVPTFYTRLLAQSGLTRDAVAGMRLFISGSAPLLAETHDQWRERTGTAILERYGMTETGMNTSNPYDGDRVAGTVGPQSATATLDIDGRHHTVQSTGNGPVDATFNCIKALIPHEAVLDLYQVHAVTQGTDAQAGQT